MDTNMPGDAMFSIVPVIIILGFIALIGGIILAMLKGVAVWSSNNNEPVLTVEARVVNKRTNARFHNGAPINNGDNGFMASSSHTHTDYYVTFEASNGDRREFKVNGQESGLLVEGDHGQLTYQGTRYKGFQR